MFDRSGVLLMSNGKWPRVRLVVVVTSTLLVVISIPFPVAALVSSAIRHVQPTAEYLFTVIAPNVWNWITPSYLYVLLNILIVALGFQSGALTVFNSDYAQAQPSTNFVQPGGYGNVDADGDVHVEDTHEPDIQTRTDANSNTSMISAGCGNLHQPDETTDSKANSCSDLKRDIKPSVVETQEERSNLKEAKSTAGSYSTKSRVTLLRRSTTGLSNLCKEITHVHTQLTPHLDFVRDSVVFEICADQGEVDDAAEEDHKVCRREVSLSSEELYAKAESFIGNFYRELKMQRENSWKRLCAIYRQSS